MNKFKIKLAQVIIFIGQNLFFVRGKIRNFFWRFILALINYDTKSDPKNSRVKTRVNGVPFFFYFDYLSDVKLAFGNYNYKEIDFIKKNMNNDSIFIDIGSNIGFYTMNIANIFPKINFLKIISIEPNPIMIERQMENLELLENIKKGVKNKVFLENYAISESEKNLQLNFEKGYGPAVLTKNVGEKTIAVKTTTLIKILKKNNIRCIDCLKIDVEGHEDLALLPFFKSAEKSLFPKHIVIEHTSSSIWIHKDLMDFLSRIGYKIILKTRSNSCLTLIA
ncbi:FkbM family methyltransferase [Pelagibacteraceae bacterium]|jgi:FkbM family methyltransferase|nr:FkbM family methyltransferase [Pelagibacteraceae bacterium]